MTKLRRARRPSRKAKSPQEEFDSDFDATPKQFYVDLLAACDGDAGIAERAFAACATRSSATSRPSFSKLKTTLEEVRQTVKTLLQRKREKEPDAPVAGAATEAGAGAGTRDRGGAGLRRRRRGRSSTGQSQRRRPCARAGRQRGRHRARRGRGRISSRTRIAYSPAPLPDAARAAVGRIARRRRRSIDQTMLAAPPSEIRQNLKRLRPRRQTGRELLESRRNRHGHGMRARLAGFAALRGSCLFRIGSVLRTHPPDA